MTSGPRLDSPPHRHRWPGLGEWLLQRGEARFGLWTVRWLLLFAAILAVLPFEHASGPRTGATVTLVSWWPEAWLRSPAVYFAVRIWLLASVFVWATWRLIPWSCWSTVIAFTVLWSLRMENVTNGAHIFNVTNTLLFIHALWFQFYWRELRLARLEGEVAVSLRPSLALPARWLLQVRAEERAAAARVYPRWAFWLSVFYIGWFHSLAGWTKLWVSGPGWGDGTSLQLWMSLFAEPNSPLVWPVMADRTFASVLQTGSLWIESLSLLCILGRWPRYLVGFTLFGFYCGVLGTFTMFGFHFNCFLAAWFLLPVDRWMGLVFRENEAIQAAG